MLSSFEPSITRVKARPSEMGTARFIFCRIYLVIMKATESRTYDVGRQTSLDDLSIYLRRLGATPADAIPQYGVHMREPFPLSYSFEYRMWIENLKITFQDRPDGKYATITGKYAEQARCNRHVDGLWRPGGEVREDFSYTAKVPAPVTTTFPDSQLQFRELDLEEIASFDAQFERDSKRTLVHQVCDWFKQLVA